MRLNTMTWAGLLAALLLASGVHAAEKVALVIGNAKYQHTTTLANPVNDARDIAAALRNAGFAVEPVVENADKARLQAALAAFADKAHGARQALVYYAGHGIEAAGENYLVPVDAPLRNERTVSLEAVKLSDVLAVVSSAGQLGLVVLDACRDNPLAARMQRIDATRSATRGLGPPGEPGGNLMVVYAAEAGRVAADGAGRNSPFTQAVLGALNAPPMEVRQFWGHVRDQVFRSTGGAQRPFTYGSLGGEAIYLAGRGVMIQQPQPAGSVALTHIDESANTNLRPVATFTSSGVYHFSSIAPGVLRDNRTGREWTQSDSGYGMSKKSATAYCNTLSIDGSGWRLPSVAELKSIYDQSERHSVECGDDICGVTKLFRLSSWAVISNGDGGFLFSDSVCLQDGSLCGPFKSEKRVLCTRNPR